MPSEASTHAALANHKVVDCNAFIAAQLLENLGDLSIRQIARTTRFNAETARRYMGGSSRIPADFIQQACRGFDLDANLILLGRKTPLEACDMHSVPTELLLQELGRRIVRIEDCAVGRVAISESVFRDDVGV